MKKTKLFIITGPSAVGKTTVAGLVVKKMKNLQRIVTYTTRQRRRGERNGRDYNFISVEEFKKRIKEKEFFEWAINYDNYYGNSRKDIQKLIKQGKTPLFVIDIKGALKIKKIWPGGKAIFILPESLKQLENRLKKRLETTPTAIKKRLAVAKWEIDQAPKCDYWVVNREGKIIETVLETADFIKQSQK